MSDEKDLRGRPWSTYALGTGVLALLTRGLLAPVALVLAIIALRKGPRGPAFCALVLSLVGLAYGVRQYRRGLASFESHQLLREIESELRDFHGEFARWPDAHEFEERWGGRRDAFERPLRYVRSEAGFDLRSAGPDGDFDSADDLVIDAAD